MTSSFSPFVPPFFPFQYPLFPSTGNAAVEALAFHVPTQTLFAGVDSLDLDCYSSAKKDVEWPRNAFYPKDYFGKPWNLADHALLSYRQVPFFLQFSHQNTIVTNPFFLSL